MGERHSWDEGLAAYERSDYETAVQEWRPLAEQGHAKAQFYLGVMYVIGQGIPQDYAQAHMWFDLAASHYSASEKESRSMAVKHRDRAAAMMTPAQIVEAQKLVREWQEQHK